MPARKSLLFMRRTILRSVPPFLKKIRFLSPAFVEIEVLGVALVVITEVFWTFATWRVVVVHSLPGNQPATGPWPCISALVVNRRFIFEGVVIHTRETFDEMKKTGVRQTASNHPK